MLLLSIASAFAAPAWCQTTAPQAVMPILEADKHPGYGTVESVTEVRVMPGERSAAAGGSAPSGASGAESRPAWRVAVRMADGSVQYRDLHKPEFQPGQNVLLTNAGEILRD
jgi:hypothetical protein